MVYPSGKVMIAIEATNHPFQWYSYDDWMIIRGEICGSIHQRFKNRLSIEPLIHRSVDEWTVKQFDINYDVPLLHFLYQYHHYH